jgi:hypothetical protein
MTVQQGADFLANRQVGLRYSCVPSLEKWAQGEGEAGAAAGGAAAGAEAGAEAGGEVEGGEGGEVGGTLAALLANPSIQASLWGVLGGSTFGLLAGLRRKKERRNLLRDILTGAIAGGVSLGGLHLAASTLMDKFNENSTTPQNFDLPAIDAESQQRWIESKKALGWSDDKIQTFQAEQLAAWRESDSKAQMNYLNEMETPGEDSWYQPGQWGSTASRAPGMAGAGAGRFLGDFAASQLGGDDSTWGETGGNVGGVLGGYAAPAWLASAGANKIKTPYDLSGRRLGSIGESLFGEKAYEPTKGNPQGKRLEPSKALNELYEHRFGKGMVDPVNLDIIRKGLHGGDTDSLRKLHDLLVSGPTKLPAATHPDYRAAVDANTARVSAKKSFMDFLSDVREAEAKHLKAIPAGEAKIPFGNISHADARLGHIAGVVQRGQIPGLNKFTGLNPRIRPNAPLIPKVPWTMRLPKIRGWGGIAAYGIPTAAAVVAHNYYKQTDASQTFGDNTRKYLQTQPSETPGSPNVND